MRLAWFALVFISVAALGADGTFTGYARSLETGELLYVESHAVSGAGTAAEARVVLYRCAGDVAPFARKELDYGASRLAPAFGFEDARSGFTEGLTRDARGISVFVRAGSRGTPKREPLAAAGTLVADAGFDEFVRTRWDALERGVALEAPFLVPSRLTSMAFHVHKLRDETVDGAAASVIRLSLAGPLGWFLPDIDVTYRKDDRRLLRYRGITNIRDASGRPLNAEIDFPDSGRSTAKPDLAALRAMPLTSSCGS